MWPFIVLPECALSQFEIPMGICGGCVLVCVCSVCVHDTFVSRSVSVRLSLEPSYTFSPSFNWELFPSICAQFHSATHSYVLLLGNRREKMKNNCNSNLDAIRLFIYNTLCYNVHTFDLSCSLIAHQFFPVLWWYFQNGNKENNSFIHSLVSTEFQTLQIR